MKRNDPRRNDPIENDFEKAKYLLSDQRWRLSHLYYIVDKYGNKQLFKPNWAQNHFLDNIWYLNVILKARQLGFSTLVDILLFDSAFFNSNVSVGIIAHTREDAEKMFRRIKYAYDNMHPTLRDLNPSTIDSARELKLANGSTITVGTSMRSTTLNYLHVSEAGKIGAKYPEKAREIITGSFNTLAPGQYIFVESTAEGAGGFFYDLYKQAEKNMKEKESLTMLDFKPHFYPWWREPEYQLDAYREPPEALKEYFYELEEKNIHLSGAQVAWYINKWEVMGDDMTREFPSFPDEAFLSSGSGLFYGMCLQKARNDKRIGNVCYDPNAPVYTAWDIGLGVGGYTAIWFYQVCGNEIHVIDFYQDNGKPMIDYIHYVKSKPYVYDRHFGPHDLGIHEYSLGYTRKEVARQHGFDFTIVNKEEGKPIVPVVEGIDAVKNLFPRFWFDQTKCEEGLLMLENYRKQWDDRLCRWSDKAVKDNNAHASDAFRMLALSIPHIEADKGSSRSDYEAVKAYYGL